MNHANSPPADGFSRRVEVPSQFTHWVDWQLAADMIAFRGLHVGAINLYVWLGMMNFEYVTTQEDHAIIWCINPDATLDRYSFNQAKNYRSTIRHLKALKDCGLLLNQDLRVDPWPRLSIDLRVVKKLEMPNEGPDHY